MRKLRAFVCAFLALAVLCSPALAAVSLSRGDQGAWVAALQLRLNTVGYSIGTIDGDFGGKTKTAIEQFQGERGLTVNGEADDATWSALYDEHVDIENSAAHLEVKLTPPFATLTLSPDNGGTAIMDMDGVSLSVQVVTGTLDEGIEAVESVFAQTYQDAAASMTVSENQTGTEFFFYGYAEELAAVISSTFHYTADELLVHYGCVALLPLGKNMLVEAQVYFNCTAATEEFYRTLFNNDTMKEVAANITKVSEYEAVEGASVSDLLPLILKYVDVAANESAEINDAVRVNMYYGAKLMTWFTDMVAAGNDRDAVLNEARLQIVVSAMNQELKARYDVLSEKYLEALFSLVLFPEEETRAALAEMGIPEITWVEDDIAEMYNRGVDAITSIS